MSIPPKLPSAFHLLRDAHQAGRVAARTLAKFTPLSSVQRSWLTGFLAELLDASTDAHDALSTHPQQVPLTTALLEHPADGELSAGHGHFAQTVVEGLHPHSSVSQYSIDNPFSAKVVAVHPNKEHEPNIWRVTLDLAGSGMLGRPGAMLGAIATNDPDHVRDLLSRFKGAGQQSVTTSRGSGPAWRALLEECNLFLVTEPLLRLLAASTQRNSEATELKRLVTSGEYHGSVLGVLRRFPGAKPSIADFVAKLSPLAPQIFPLASVAPKGGTYVEAIVRKEPDDHRALVEQLERGRPNAGEWLPVFVTLQPQAHPPEDPNAPVILIAPGLTAAWANTFLAERAATRGAGRNWVFTCPPPGDASVLYSEAFSTWQTNRTLTRLDISTPEELIHRLSDQGEMILAWLLDRSYLYVFGSVQECRQLLVTMAILLAERLKTSREHAESRLTEMRSKGLLRVVECD